MFTSTGFGESMDRDSHRRIPFNTSGIVFHRFFLTLVTDARVERGNCRNVEASLNQGTVKSHIKQKYKWMIPDCSRNEEMYSVLVVFVLKQAACLILVLLLTHPVPPRQEGGSTANRKQQPCAVSGFQCDLVRLMCSVGYPGSSRNLAPNC